MTELQQTGKLSDRVSKNPDANFRRNWKQVCKRAGVVDGTFHDLRATCVTDWFEQGLLPHEVQKLAGHASIDTTMRYYVAVKDTIVDRARVASSQSLPSISVANLLQYPKKPRMSTKKAVPTDLQVVDTAHVTTIGARGLEPPTS